MSGYNLVEFKRLLETLSIRKVDADNFADFLDKNEDGFITHENFVTAVVNFGQFDPRKPAKQAPKAEVIPPVDASEYIMPLSTVLKRQNVNEVEILRKYDRKGDKNMLLSAGEIAEIYKDFLKEELKEPEVRNIENHMRKAYGRKEIRRSEWQQFLLVKANFAFDQGAAREQMQRLQQSAGPVQNYLRQFMLNNEEVTVRNFKFAL